MTPSGYEWTICKNVKSDSHKLTCTIMVPSDEDLVQGPVTAKGYWADCKDGFVLGPILCDLQGSEISEPFRIYNESIPTKPAFISTTSTTSVVSTTSTSSTISSTSASTASISSSSPTAKKSSNASPSSSKTLYTLGLIFGILVFLICLGIGGFILWAKNQSKKERNLNDLLNFEIDTSNNKPLPRHLPKAESPFPDRPVYYYHQMDYGSSMAQQPQGYSLVNSDAVNGDWKYGEWNQ